MSRVTGSIQNKNNKGVYHMMVRIKMPDGTIKNKSKSTGIKVGRNKTEDKKARREANAMLEAWILELEAEAEAEAEAETEAEADAETARALPETDSGAANQEHMQSFQYAYMIDALFDWLMAQSK
mgnify:CR=1 FL=1